MVRMDNDQHCYNHHCVCRGASTQEIDARPAAPAARPRWHQVTPAPPCNPEAASAASDACTQWQRALDAGPPHNEALVALTELLHCCAVKGGCPMRARCRRHVATGWHAQYGRLAVVLQAASRRHPMDDPALLAVLTDMPPEAPPPCEGAILASCLLDTAACKAAQQQHPWLAGFLCLCPTPGAWSGPSAASAQWDSLAAAGGAAADSSLHARDRSMVRASLHLRAAAVAMHVGTLSPCHTCAPDAPHQGQSWTRRGLLGRLCA